MMGINMSVIITGVNKPSLTGHKEDEMDKLVVTDLGIEVDEKNECTRHWYKITGHYAGFNRDFDDEYAVCSDGSILDRDGCPLTPGDNETEAVRLATRSY